MFLLIYRQQLQQHILNRYAGLSRGNLQNNSYNAGRKQSRSADHSSIHKKGGCNTSFF